MIILIAVRNNPNAAGGIERCVVGPYNSEADFQPDMTAAERAGFKTSAFEIEDPAVFRSTLGAPL